MYSNLIMRGVLTFLLVTVLAVPTRAQADKFVPHKNVPGPPRLDMEKADNSGAVNADVQFIADRQAIINHHEACYNFFSKPRHVRGSDGHGRCAHQRFRSVSAESFRSSSPAHHRRVAPRVRRS